MKRKITDFALGSKCGPKIASWISPASAQSPPMATPRKPPPARAIKFRREMRPQGNGFVLSNINELVEVEDEPGQLLEPSGVILEIRGRAIFFRGRGWPPDREAPGELDRFAQVTLRVGLQACRQLGGGVF